jgi:protein SCO1
MSNRLSRDSWRVVLSALTLCAWNMVGWASPAAGQVAPTFQGSPRLIDQVGIDPKFGQQVPLDLEFVDADGAKVRLSECFVKRPLILQLVYYECPMLCKLSSDGLFKAVQNLELKPGRDFSIVTLSFDPREGPELSRRARTMAINRCGEDAVDRGWHFLTGDQQAIAALTKSVGFRYAFDEQSGQFAHASGIFVLSPEGKISRYLSGVDYPPRDLRLAIVEASAGKVGTMADQVLLLCCMYDPTTGRYGLAIMTALRVAGLVTVAVMGAGIFMMLRRDRGQRAHRIDAALLGEPLS